MDYFKLRGVDAAAYTSAQLPAWLTRAVQGLEPDANLLDFGCGFGQNIRELKGQGFSCVYGADVNSQALAHCRSVGFDVYDVAGGFKELESSGIKFDAIVTTHVLEHIPKDAVIQTLAVLRGLLKPGGMLLAAVPNAQAYTGCYWAYEDFTHHTLYTHGSLLYILRAAGFSQVDLLDRYAIEGSSKFRGGVRLLLTKLYAYNYIFWKKILGSPTHISSTDVFSYELKVRARI